MRATLTFAAAEVVFTVPALAGDRIGLKQSELDAARADIAGTIVRRIVVTGDGAPCPGELDTATLTAGDGVELTAHFACRGPPHVVDIDLAVLDFLASQHRHLAHASWATESTASTDWVAERSSSAKEIRVDGPSASRNAGLRGPLPLFRMGVEHILRGYDHLLFLAGLALVSATRARFGSLALAITAFTVAHSITLGLATLGVWGPSARLVEPAIALSIAYVGVENCVATDFAQRWRVTFAFGLLHGFGFASALREVSMPRSELPVALLSFNLGVEAGQLAAVGVLVAGLGLARSRGAAGERATKVLSVGVAVTGLIWFLVRALGA